MAPLALAGETGDKRLRSTGWKDVTLTIFGSKEKVTLPVMISSKVADIKRVIAEMHGGVAPHEIELVYKVGVSFRRHRNGDEVNTNLLVKGIKSFHKGVFEWNHPYTIIGGGFMGLRQGLHFTRLNLPYCLFERKNQIGGNAWAGIANRTSKLQTEGPQYQLQWDVFDGGCEGLYLNEHYSFWPSRDEILGHLRRTCDERGVTPNIRLNASVEEMIIKTKPGNDLRLTHYEWHWKSTISDETGIWNSSILMYYPGCLVVPHRKTWPGEDVFEGLIGYGFAHEFDYVQVKGQDALIIGMGAFAHENVRTFVECGGRKAYNIARHFNLLMPRVVCWWVNQSVCPPTAAMVLNSMEPMYAVCGWSPWNFFSVTANPERTTATIKQYTRWGIADVHFLACYFDKCEIINAEVKRMKSRGAVLSNGRVLEDLDHMIKVIGFDGDFTVDRLMRTTRNVGPWPDGDWRRWTMSDQSAIDASRFTNIAISPAVSSMSNMTTYYAQHPEVGFGCLATGMLPENFSEPELGSPAYHYEPRKGTSAMMVVGGFAQELGAFEELNSKLKKGSHHYLAHPAAWVRSVERDWLKYCKMFTDQGNTKPWPRYPYQPQDLKRLCVMEDELGQQEQAKMLKRMGYEVPKAAPASAQEEAPAEAGAPGGQLEGPQDHVQQIMEQQKARDEMEYNPTPMLPELKAGEHMSFEPMRRVLASRNRSQSPRVGLKPATEEDRRQWHSEGLEAKNWLIKNSKR